MTGLGLLWAAIHQVIANFAVALRIAWLPVMLISMLYTWVHFRTLADPAPGDHGLDLVFWLQVPLYLFLFAWIAVPWHRFALLGERPATIVPLPGGHLVLGYAWRTFAIAIASLLPVLVLIALFAVLLIGPFAADEELPYFLSRAPLTFLSYCVLLILSMVLPGYAIGRPQPGLRRKMVRRFDIILVLALSNTLYIVGLGDVFEDLAGDSLVLFAALTAVDEFAFGMITIAQLTVLYEFFAADGEAERPQ